VLKLHLHILVLEIRCFSEPRPKPGSDRGGKAAVRKVALEQVAALEDAAFSDV
jgi:hypothetical protein